MKAIKNKKRFDARRFLSERKEETKENIEEIKVSFNDFSFDNWLEEESVKEFQVGDGARDPYAQSEVPPPTKENPKRKSDEELAKELADREPGKMVKNTYEEGCGEPEMGPEEDELAVTDLSPDEAFGAGYTAAVEEIMASIQGLLEDPIEMGTAPGEEEKGAVDISAIFEDDDEMVGQLPKATEYSPDDPVYMITTNDGKNPEHKSQSANEIGDWYDKFSEEGYSDEQIIVTKNRDPLNDIFDEPGYDVNGDERPEWEDEAAELDRGLQGKTSGRVDYGIGTPRLKSGSRIPRAGRRGVSESLRVQEDSDQEERDTAVQKLDDIVNKDWKEKHYYVIKRGEMRSVRKPGTLGPKGHEVVRQRTEDGLRSFASRLKAGGEPYATNLPDELDLEES